jgi:uncharacterized membrane protein
MPKARIAAASALILLLCSAARGAVAAASDLKFTMLQAPGYTYTVPLALNDLKEIVGTVGNGTGPTLSFHYTEPAYTIFTVKNSLYTQAQGINSKGAIIGEYRASTKDYAYRSFIVRGARTTTFKVSGAISTYAYSLSDSGEIGGGVRGHNGSIYGFLEMAGNITYVDLGDLTFTTVTSVSSTGNYAGFYHDITLGFLGFKNINGSQQVVSFPGSSYTTVNGMNKYGDVVGDFFIGANKDRHGFLLSGTTYTQIDYPGTTTGSDATGINDHGDIVGFWSDTSAAFGFLTHVKLSH